MPDESIDQVQNQLSTMTLQHKPTHMYTETEVYSYLVGAIVAIIICINGGFDIYVKIKSFFTHSKDDRLSRKEEHAELERRLDCLETNEKNFRTSDELDRDFHRIEDKFDLFKSNNTQIIDQLHSALKNLANEVSYEQKARVRMETQMEAYAANARRIENAVEALRERIDERFDKITDLIDRHAA